MGNYVNKFFPRNTEAYNNKMEKEEIRCPSSTDEVTLEKDIMETPPIVRKTLIDPRSITSGINRTPIEVNCTPLGTNKKMISAIPKHLQTKRYLETDIDKIMLCLTPVKHFMPKAIDIPKVQLPTTEDKGADIPLTPTTSNLNNEKVITDIEKERFNILGLDPRSPAANFDRTPILMPKSIKRLRARSQEFLHRAGSYDTDIFYPKFSYCETSSQFNVTEVQALPSLTATDVKSLNSVINDCDNKSKSPELLYSSHSSGNESTSAIEIFASAKEELEDQNEFQRISGQNKFNGVCVKKDIEEKKTCVTSNDIIKVWRDSLILDESQALETSELDNVQIIEEKIAQVSKEEVIITFDDDNIAKLANFESEKTKIDTIRKKKKNLKSEVKIPIDEKKFSNSINKDGSESTKIRTPLGNRSNNGQVQTLLIKSPQQVFRNKGIASKILQENTPPHKKHITKSKLGGIQWDPDSTVII
ncbi:uncharacterized protein LOC100647341 isoform X1 [Bombus terrestris]|uniref:Uncharacterized protein LOC100647341 isoform X1 n=1 Tax=Bombus terrestris TaxID=30195 RepID=A0A9C6SKR3_BOMTE|nr:uncharacterized protein LOC100647341 isoform X1 [Bombus terrestris]